MSVAQRLFDAVAVHLLAQGERAQMGGALGGCRYRLLKNDVWLKCAVGGIISDDNYKEMQVEGHSADHDAVIFAVAVSQNMMPQDVRVHASLLMDLQNIHDVMDACKWKVALQRLASGYNLSSEKIDACPYPRQE